MNDKKVFIIAEAGVNHDGKLPVARRLIDVAALAGADAVKFQIFNTDNLASAHMSQYEMLKGLELGKDDFLELSVYCKKKSIKFLATPFDLESLGFLQNQLHADLFKVASGDITFAGLLYEMALTGKPVILSTGMSTCDEIRDALGLLAFGYLRMETQKNRQNFTSAFNSTEGRKVLKEKVTLLHCTSEYPAPFDQLNLKAMETLKKNFDLKIGYSDHSVGINAPIAAVAMGARVIEKHFTLDKTMQGPDHAASLNPDELSAMVKGIREVEDAFGSGEKRPAAGELATMKVARRSLVAAGKIKAGDVFNFDNLAAKRPGTGTSPMKLWNYLGKRAEKDYEKDELI